MRRELRLDVSTAPILSINSIAFDCYQPDSKFAAATPGLPDFCVAITYFNEPSLLFDDIQQLLKLSSAEGSVSLKIATVSDSGTVIMLGVTDFGVPDMTTK